MGHSRVFTFPYLYNSDMEMKEKTKERIHDDLLVILVLSVKVLVNENSSF